ncbi:DUF4012 domain-containing protein [bacterium]|nr:DUF4012 domain-containing protein [bacterium]
MKNPSIRRKVDPNAPVSLLVHGSNPLSIDIAKALIEQGGTVILVDHFNAQSKQYITQLKEHGQADFIDFKGLPDLLNHLPRVDYIFYFLHDYLSNSKDFSSKDFLEETNHLNEALKGTKRFDSKLSLLTTIKLNQDLSAHVLNSNLSTPSPYSPIELQKYCETLTAETRDKQQINARIIRLGALLGPENQNITDETVSRLVSEAVNKPYLNIYGEGLDIHYLIHTSDASYGILKLTFSNRTEGEVISLANNHDYTTLSLAYKLLELNPEITEIKFQPSDESRSIVFDQYVPATNASQFGWVQKYSLEQTLIEAITAFHPEKGKRILEAPTRNQAPEQQEDTLKKSETHNTILGNMVAIMTSPFTNTYNGIRNWLKTEREAVSPKRFATLLVGIIVLTALFYFVFMPIIGFGLGSLYLYRNTKQAVESFNSFDFKGASAHLDQAKYNTNRNSHYLNQMTWLFKATNSQDLYDNSSQLLFASEYALSGASTLTKSLEPLASYAKEFQPSLDFGNTTPASSREYRIYLKELQENLSGIDRASYNLTIATELLSKVDVAAFPKLLQPHLTQLKLANESIISQVGPSQQILSLIPDLLGVDSRQTYLVLLQNPGELRSTGGWLSSYAIVGIEGGQIRELKVDDVYNAEGQLKIAKKTFAAPKDMQTALDMTNWSMSLSNWNPNFPDSARTAEYFLNQLDSGSEFSGVITLDTEVIKMLLDKWGGLQVAGESEPITASNLDQKIFQLHSQFTPGQSVKSTFLANLANETLKKLFTLDFTGYKDIADVLFKSLNEKHILVFSKNPDAKKFFEKSMWAGVLDDKYQWAPMPVEWNWGANKANLYLERNHTLQVNIIDETHLEYDYTLFIQNKSTSKIYPQGDYENYFRIYLPLNAEVASVKGYLDNNYTIYRERGQKVIGGWFNVPAKTTKSFQVKYRLTKRESDLKFPIVKDGEQKSFDLSIFKQPGTFNDVYDLSLIYPDTWDAKQHDGLTRAVNTLTARFNLSTDKTFNLNWTQK